MKLDHTGPVQISAHLTEILPGVANWLLQKGVLQVTVAFFTSPQYSPQFFVPSCICPILTLYKQYIKMLVSSYVYDFQIDWCTDVLSGHAHLSYSLDTSGSVVDPGSSDPCLSFKLVSVPNSNLYVIIYKPSTTCKSSQVSTGLQVQIILNNFHTLLVS